MAPEKFEEPKHESRFFFCSMRFFFGPHLLPSALATSGSWPIPKCEGRRIEGRFWNNGGVCKMHGSRLYSRISIRSLNPSVVIRPTLAPLRSIKVLVATVVPWISKFVFSSKISVLTLLESAIDFRPVKTPSDGSCGVDGVLKLSLIHI